MPRALLLSTTIVAAFQFHPAAAATLVNEVPLSPAVMSLARRVDIAPAADRGRFIVDIVPLLYPTPESKLAPDLAREPAARRAASDNVATIMVPVALPAEVWSRAIFRRAVAPQDLLTAILRDWRAAYLARGLAGVDDDTLEYLSGQPDLLRYLYEQGAPAFAGFGDVLRVRAGRVVVPYGDVAASLWESAIGQPLTDPNRVIRVVFGEHGGRLAYLLSTIESAGSGQARFALGLSIDDARVRTERFTALAAACLGGYGEWHIDERPFSRPLADLATFLLRLRVDANGVMSEPASRAFWRQVYGGAELPGLFRGSPVGAIDAAWLIEQIGGLDMYARAERLEQFSFAQRVFLGTASQEPLLTIVRSFPSRRMLLLSLERMEIRDAAVYAGALAAADAVEQVGTGRRFWALGQYQGALALLVRMHRVGAIDTRRAASLATSLSAIRDEDGDYSGPVARWIRDALSLALPAPGAGWESRLVAALSGPDDPRRTPRVLWEGQSYRFDAAAAERRRIAAVRVKQGGHTLDLAMTLDALSTTLQQERLTLDDVRAAEATLDTMAVDSGLRLRRPAVNLLPPAVSVPRDGLQWINAARADLKRIDRPGEVRNAARVGASLRPLVDIALGNALVSINYAAEIGVPEGAALLAGNVALRHDFGLGRRQADLQMRQPWALPRQDFLPGVPWHVSGSLLGLDIALASLQTQRLSIDRIADAPRLSSVEREAMAVGVVMLNPRLHSDADLAAIADGVARGRTAIRSVALGQAPLADVISRLRLDGWRTRALQWSLVHEPANLLPQLTLADLLTIDGGVAPEVLDRWGPSGLNAYGCACSRFVGSREARVLEGRYQLPIVAATMGDLTLAVAVMLRDLHLPAVLARPVLTVGLPDFIDGVVPTNAGVWWGVAREAQVLRRQRIEDYVSAAAAVDGPLIPEGLDSSAEE